MENTIHDRQARLPVSTLIFYTVFAFAFLIGGAVFLFGILPFRLFYLVPIALLLLPKYGIRISAVEKIFFVFFLEIVASALQNHSSATQFISFLRFVITPFSMYYLCKNYIKEHNAQKIMQLCIKVACLQPILVFFQQAFFDQVNSILPAQSQYPDSMDFSFGTFYASDDPSMSFFLMGLVIFLLFDNLNNQFVRNKLLLAGYFTLGVLFANSQLSNLLVIFIWVVFLLRKFKVKDLVKSLSIVLVAASLVLSLGFYDFLKWKISDALTNMSMEAIVNASGADFEEGRYERTAAVLYYVTQPLKILGDGPSAYYDAMNKEYVLANTGQIFTLYAEVGILGLALGYLIFFVMSRQKGVSKPMGIGCFLLVSALTITTFVLTDSSIILAYSIFLRTNLISKNKEFVPSLVPDGAKGL